MESPVNIWARRSGFIFLQCVLYFLVMLALEAAIGLGRGFGYDTAHVVPFWSKAAEIMHGLWPTDFALYLHGAELIPIYRLRTFTGSFGMYPPGLSYIYYAILKLWPLAPLYAIVFFAALGLWAIVFALLAIILRRVFSIRDWIAFLIPFLLLVFPFFTNGFLWWSVGLTESIGSPLFAIGCIGSLLLFLTPRPDNWPFAIVIGLVFAASVYIRAQFDLMLMGLIVLSLMLLIAWWITGERKALKTHAFMLLAIVFAYQGATIPYKIFKHAPTIVVMDYGWGQVWTKKEDAEKYHVYVNHGMQSVCEIAMDQCQEFTDRRNRGEEIDFREYRHAALVAVAQHPLALLKFKLPIFWHNWFIDMFEDMPAMGSYRWISDFILAFSIPAVAVYAFLHNRRIGLAYALYAGMFVTSCLIFSLLVHIEPRYFLPIKFLAAVSLLFVLTGVGRRWRRNS